MVNHDHASILLSDVDKALRDNKPVVALESAVITHGLPRPVNLQTARELETIIRSEGCVPATIGVLDGLVHVGLTESELEILSTCENPRKISRRDFGYAAMRGLSGGTTVAATMMAAHNHGIKVFATGGIGGVHRGSQFDVSADLEVLGSTTMIVVCAGAKAILDLFATMEVLETLGVLVAGFQTDELPAFYSQSSGIKLDARFETPEEIATAAKYHWQLDNKSAILITQPIPLKDEIPAEVIETWIQEAVVVSEKLGIHGPALTPFLLDKIKTLSEGRTLTANISLLQNNARLAARIARSLTDNS